jgi:flagellar export protein FliJ
MAFNFRLRRILEYRRYLERIAQIDLAMEIQNYKKKDKQLKNLIREKQQLLKECKKMVQMGTNVPVYRIYGGYIEKLKRDIEDTSRDLDQIKVLILEKQKKLKEISVNRKVLEGLKDRREREYIYYLNKKEQMQTDELFLLKRR